MAALISIFALYLAILDEDDLVTYSRDEWVADCNPDDGQAAYCDCVYDSLDDDLDEEHINELAGGVDSENISRQTKQALKGAMDECGHLGRDS